MAETDRLVTRKLITGTGWKMNKTPAEASLYLRALLPLLRDADLSRVEVFVLPPFTSLATVASLLNASAIGFGAQNMHWDDSGAWTGEVSAPMLVETGCRYVEIGHSERRTHFGETDDTVNRKVLTALRHLLIPILCIGETHDEKTRGDTEPVLLHQIDAALRGVRSDAVPDVILAYEPRWAIGQAEAAPPAYINDVHRFIRSHIARQHGIVSAEQTRIIYGGSVNLNNAAEIVEQADVDGLFVGRAALEPHNFVHLIKLAEVEALRRATRRNEYEDRNRL